MSSAPVHEGKFFGHQKTDSSFLSAETQADQRRVDRMSNHVRFPIRTKADVQTGLHSVKTCSYLVL